VSPVDILATHEIEVDVYSGPFLTKTLRRQYFVRLQNLVKSASMDGQTVTANVAPKAGFSIAGKSHTMEADDFSGMLPVTTTIIEGAVSTDNLLLSQTHAVDEGSWSVEFTLYGDRTGEIALQVFDEDGFCVGYLPEKGGDVREFAAFYDGFDSFPQSVSILNAVGQTFTVKAVLVASDTPGPFDVQVYAVEVPFRPAVLALTPSEITVSTWPGRDVTIPVLFGEASHQQPLGAVEVIAPTLELIPGDVLVLQPTFATASSFDNVLAGDSESAEIVYQISADATPGQYLGDVLISSVNAGQQPMSVSISIFPSGDATTDCVVDVADLIFVRNRLGMNIDVGLNKAADVNNDEVIDILDLVYVRNRLGDACTE